MPAQAMPSTTRCKDCKPKPFHRGQPFHPAPPVSQGTALPSGTAGNRPARAEWFKDQALGMFIHWSVDCPLGSVISHHLVGSTKDCQDRFFSTMPDFFNPKDFNPGDWARLAKLAGMKYVVFTTKHHAGFCMWDTKTTDFNIMNSPYGRDLTRELFDAFRVQQIAIGVYLSPDDFWILHKQGHPITRTRPEADPRNNPELMQHNLKQVGELLTDYGKIDFIFFDGEPDRLKQLAWELEPDIIVTRGEIATPEQHLPGEPLPGPWEACFTMGTEWPFKPTNNEGSVWFTKAKDTDTVYAFETDVPWKWATWRDFSLKSVRATANTQIEIVGQTGDHRCWSTGCCKATWSQEADGLHIRAMFAQRLYTNCKWPNPIAIRITHAEPVPAK